MKRADGTALSVIVVLFDHHKSLRNHRDTSTLEQYPILSRTISVMPRETLKHTARGSAHASEPKSRRKVHDENVHEVDLPKDPVIVVEGGNSSRENSPRASTTQRLRRPQHPAELDRTAGAPGAPSSCSA